jgi:hypothetical protein
MRGRHFEEYLYELYRGDAIPGIQEAVTPIKSSPHAVEDDLSANLVRTILGRCYSRHPGSRHTNQVLPTRRGRRPTCKLSTNYEDATRGIREAVIPIKGRKVGRALGFR